MLSAVLLLVSATVVGTAAPSILKRVDVTKQDPVLVLVAWLAAIVGVVTATVGSAVVLLLPEHGATLVPRALSSHWAWHSFTHGASTAVECFVGIAGVVLLLALAVWLGNRIIRATRRRLQTSDTNAALLRAVGRTMSATPDVLRLDHADPVAFAISGSSDLIVATEGVFQLGDAAAAAVLAHERAHLRGRHHVVLMWTSVLGKALPIIPLFRQAPVAIAEIVEMCADTAAARECGDQAVRTALIRMAMRRSPTVALAMADHAIERRLLRLARSGERHVSATRRTLLRVVTGVIAVTVPFHLTVTFLHVAIIA
ncbi:M56 family metallopeptidase [Nocardia barduliensis]|uniref:M56 family metallopeptidase n=1 Tax=Nocardia barduliensis TaxID=2736643 RepID=UPI0015718860|nr:M56 family metallopeptidase [Nocardia barduliensis]